MARENFVKGGYSHRHKIAGPALIKRHFHVRKLGRSLNPQTPNLCTTICILLFLITVSSASLTLFSKFFSSFPHGTCLLSVSCQYLALDECLPPN